MDSMDVQTAIRPFFPSVLPGEQVSPFWAFTKNYADLFQLVPKKNFYGLH
jgi:hypothetical protein